MDYIKVNEANKLIYVALNKTTGLSDLVLQPYDEAGVTFGTPTSFTELANGAYEASFTPDAVGVWRVRVSSASNLDDAIKSYDVIATKLDDVKVVVDSVETKVDTIDTVVDATKVVVDSVETKVDTIDTVVDASKVVVDATKVVVDSVETKVDSMQSDVTEIKANVTIGGYFA